MEKREELYRGKAKSVYKTDDANRLILYFLEGTDFATGSCVRVDGGRFLGPRDV